MDRIFMLFAAFFGGLGVALGAFGAHALSSVLSERMLANFETGVRYQMYHAFALLAVVVALMRWPDSNLPPIAGWLFVAGILIFSGSLYLMAWTGARWLGAITPIGGVAFVIAWALLFVTALRR